MAPLTAAQLAETTDCWLFKSEPDVRYEKGVDISFGIDKMEKAGTEPWTGVRNPQATRFMREYMKAGHSGLFYHSSCAVPGVAGLLEIIKEGYPDHTALDTKSPYYDPKSTSDKTRWHMVDVKFKSRLQHFVPLAVLQKFTAGLSKAQREDVKYLSDKQIQSIVEMPLLMPGRLSVQPVPPVAYEAVVAMGKNGGFEHWVPAKGKKAVKGKAADAEAEKAPAGDAVTEPSKRKAGADSNSSKRARTGDAPVALAEKSKSVSKRSTAKAAAASAAPEGTRRSTRTRK